MWQPVECYRIVSYCHTLHCLLGALFLNHQRNVFVFLQVECLGAKSCCHELVALWVKERMEPLVPQKLQPLQVQTAVQGNPLSWVHFLVISVEERTGSPIVSRFGI